MAASLKDVAAIAGVAPITVSRVLNRSPLVAEATRNKVLEACGAAGYRPHAGARALRAARFNTVGLLLPAAEGRANLPYSLLAGIADELESRKLNLQVMRLADRQLTDPAFAPRVLAERMVDGLLINYTVDLPVRWVEQIREHHLPSVWINIKEDTDCVYPDMFGAALRATQFLLDLGHRHIGHLDFVCDITRSDAAHYSVHDIWAGCLQAAERSPHAPRLEQLNSAPVVRRDRPACARAILARKDRPTAIVCPSNHHALTCLEAALSLGVRVPEDVSVVTFHDAPVFDDSGVEFATVAIPEKEMGRTAVDMLIKKIDRSLASLPSVSLDISFVPGDTCAPPRA